MNEQQLKTLDESIAALEQKDYSAPCSGYRQELYLDPEGHELYVFGHEGGSEPGAAWHGRHAYVCSIPTDAIPRSVRCAIAGIRDDLVALCESYLGSECDGRNLRGRWSDDRDDRGMADLRDRLAILTYWDPGEWFAGDGTDDNIRQLLGAGETPESILADLWLGDESTGEVREADALEWIRGLAS